MVFGRQLKKAQKGEEKNRRKDKVQVLCLRVGANHEIKFRRYTGTKIMEGGGI